MHRIIHTVGFYGFVHEMSATSQLAITFKVNVMNSLGYMTWFYIHLNGIIITLAIFVTYIKVSSFG